MNILLIHNFRPIQAISNSHIMKPVSVVVFISLCLIPLRVSDAQVFRNPPQEMLLKRGITVHDDKKWNDLEIASKDLFLTGSNESLISILKTNDSLTLSLISMWAHCTSLPYVDEGKVLDIELVKGRKHATAISVQKYFENRVIIAARMRGYCEAKTNVLLPEWWEQALAYQAVSAWESVGREIEVSSLNLPGKSGVNIMQVPSSVSVSAAADRNVSIQIHGAEFVVDNALFLNGINSYLAATTFQEHGVFATYSLPGRPVTVYRMVPGGKLLWASLIDFSTLHIGGSGPQTSRVELIPNEKQGLIIVVGGGLSGGILAVVDFRTGKVIEKFSSSWEGEILDGVVYPAFSTAGDPVEY